MLPRSTQPRSARGRTIPAAERAGLRHLRSRPSKVRKNEGSMQGSEFTAQQGAQIGVLVGGACGTFIGLAIVIAAVIYFARRQREAAPLSVAACPKCGSTSAKAVTYAWWGGLLGPKLLSHVECTS